MNQNLRKDLYDDICEDSNLISDLVQKNMLKVADESYLIALKMVLNKYRTTDVEKFEDWLMKQIEMCESSMMLGCI